MKLILSILFLIFSSLFVLSKDNQVAMLNEANQYYQNGDYKNASSIYEQLIADGYEKSELYYNLGNSYYRLDMIAPSILSYERALRLDPGNEDIEFNLRLANLKTVDKIEPVPKFFINKWIESAFKSRSSNSWAYIGTFFILLSVLFALLFIILKSSVAKKATFALLVLSIILTTGLYYLSAQALANQTSTSEAIVYEASVYVKSSPDENGTKLFMLHEGTKLEILDKVGNWFEIKIADGNKGWLESKKVEII